MFCVTYFSLDLPERTFPIVEVRWRPKPLRKKGKEQVKLSVKKRMDLCQRNTVGRPYHPVSSILILPVVVSHVFNMTIIWFYVIFGGITTNEEEEETQSNSESENKKQVVNETESSEDSTDEEQKGAETEGNGGNSPKEASALKDKEPARTSLSCGMESPQSDSGKGDGDDVSKSDESKKDTSSDDSDHGDGPNRMTMHCFAHFYTYLDYYG